VVCFLTHYNQHAVTERSFGVSTHLFHDHRLTREHLVHIAAHGFESIELFATRSHFDYRDDAAIGELAEWLSDTRLTLHSVHAPIVEAMRQGKWVGAFSTASGDESRRKAAVAEIAAALNIARRLPFTQLVVHLGVPTSEQTPPGDPSTLREPQGRPEQSRGTTSSGSSRATSRDDNQPNAAHRSVEEIVALATPLGVGVALEVIPNALSSAGALVRLVEEDLEDIRVGICLDYGHAHLMGDLGEAIEALSGHLVTTHLHDNRGRRDEHLVPFAGSIDWDLAMMETQKIGYDGVMMLEVADTGDPVDVLRRSAKARDRLEKTFVVF
jgi:sugar phosphate isomerase/epimerase